MNNREQEVNEFIKAFDKQNSTLTIVEKINNLKGFVAGSIEYSAFSVYNEKLWDDKFDELKEVFKGIDIWTINYILQNFELHIKELQKSLIL